MSIIFTKTFKGYEDRTAELDKAVNSWIMTHQSEIKEIVDVKPTLSHEYNARSNSGDLIYTVIYRAAQPLP